MKIAVLGTGSVGRALAGRLASLGHDVTVGTRDVAATMARTTPDAMGTPPYASWAADNPDVRLATHADATADADLVVNATSGQASIEALRAAGVDRRPGVVIADISNPLDPSTGFPPALFVANNDSLGERIQAAFPEARVVKTLNTMNAGLMVEPGTLAGGDHTVFVSGDDAEAKAVVADLLRSFGHTDVLDLGDITSARGAEMMLPLWLRLFGALGTAAFQIKVVR